MRHFPLALCCLLVLSACAAPVVKKQVLNPAAAAEVARLTRLRVAGFDNDGTGQVRAAVESALAAVLVEGRPYFTIVGLGAPSGDLGKPLQWIDTSKTKGQPIRYGAEGLVQGSVERNGWADERTLEKRAECVAEDARGRCVQTRTRTIQCTTRVAQFSFTPRVVKKDTGEVLFSQEFTETTQSRACLDQGFPIGGAALLAGARAKAIARFKNQVAPHYITLDIPLLLDDDSGQSAQTKAQIERGAELAKAGLNDKACALWLGAARSHASGYALPYLSGVCAELEDDLDQAEGLYSLAEGRSGKPVPEIAAALARLRDTRASQERLEQQLK